MPLEGTLVKEQLADVLDTLRDWTMSGIILLVAPAERGVIYVARGQPIDAAIIRASDRVLLAQSEEAFCRLLVWEHATFRFHEDQSVCRRPVRISCVVIHQTTNGFLHQTSTPSALRALTLDTPVQLSLSGLSSRDSAALEVRHWRVLAALSESHSLRELSARTSITAPEVVRTIGELLAFGFVELVACSAGDASHEGAAPQYTYQKLYHEGAIGDTSAAIAGNAPRARTATRKGVTNLLRRVQELEESV
ncbi:MAG: DUF4388 domain-containing protein [Blastochloris sp.]|nr:DUF4388 domain-containing protein [Blastochloris sp.]